VPSLWVRNVQLCVFTIPLAAIGVMIKPPQTSNLLAGFDQPMQGLVLLNGAGGLVTAAVIKYGDNILKNFATASSVVLGTIVSVYVFDFRPGLQFIAGSVCVVFAATMYVTNPVAQIVTTKAMADSQVESKAPIIPRHKLKAAELQGLVEPTLSDDDAMPRV